MVNRIAQFLTQTPITMPRPSHPKPQIATTITPALHGAVHDFNFASGIPITQIMEDALRQYLRRQYWPIYDDEGEEWREHR